MKRYLFLFLHIGLQIIRAMADEFCQQSLDGGETCEGDMNKDPEVFLAPSGAQEVTICL